jgi:hypothetical protein
LAHGLCVTSIYDRALGWIRSVDDYISGFESTRLAWLISDLVRCLVIFLPTAGTSNPIVRMLTCGGMSFSNKISEVAFHLAGARIGGRHATITYTGMETGEVR